MLDDSGGVIFAEFMPQPIGPSLALVIRLPLRRPHSVGVVQ